MIQEKQIIENLKKCPYFNACSKNLCPLDPDIELRSGKQADKCRWTIEPLTKTINNKEITFGGAVMPNAILNFVKFGQIKHLNQASREAYKRLNGYTSSPELSGD